MRERIIPRTPPLKSVRINALASGLERVAGQKANKSTNQKRPSASLLMLDDETRQKKQAFRSRREGPLASLLLHVANKAKSRCL